MARRPKEPSYFVEREQLCQVYPAIEKMGIWKSEDHYLRLFAEARDFQIIGEASQNYARLNRVTGVAERIAKFNPTARFIYVMRDPIERAISHYWYMVNFFGESREILKAIRYDPDYKDTSHYAMQLQPYFKEFGAENVKTLTLEELKGCQLETMQGIYKWLGVSADFLPESIGKRANITPAESSVARGMGILHKLRYSKFWDSIGPKIPDRIRSFGRRLSEESVVRQNVSTDHVVNYLRPIQQEQTRELEELLGRRFSEWQTLFGYD